MDIDKSIRKILIDEEVTLVKLAEKLDTSHQNLSAKLRRNNLRLIEIKEIADALGYDIKIEFHKKE